LPFGPHLAAAAWVLMLVGPALLKWLKGYLVFE
jgi:prepilin signal peptidase PulO-like enzyme (type II secretory pathway)